MKIKVSDYIAQFLSKSGITDCFMVTGGGAMHLNDALGHNENINCIFNHHEQACSIAAEAYTRMTGKLAAVCVTSGPGGTNAITGVMGAWLDSVPMLILSGQVKREMTTYSCPELGLRQLGDQEFDIIGSVKNMTKYAVVLNDLDDIAFHLEKALYLAKEGRGGPVWLDVPLDVQGAEIDTQTQRRFKKPGMPSDAVSDEIVIDVLNKIKNASAPLVLVGTGVNLAGAREELLSALEKLQIPVVTAWNANDIVSFDNPFFAGMPGTVGTRAGNFAVQNCDLILCLGCRLNIRMIGYNKFDFAKNAYKIIVDIDPKELRKPTVKPDMPICADVKEFLNKLIGSTYTPPEKHRRWLDWCKNLVGKYPLVQQDYHNPCKNINPYVFVDKLFCKLESSDRIICGNGSACVITFQAAKIKQGQRMFTNSGCAAMGYGLPAALGVAVSDNSRRTVCIDGDGSVMMNIQELATIAHNNLNIKLFIINNSGYHSIRQTQTKHFNPPLIGIDVNSGVGFPNFRKLADAFGLEYYSFCSESEADDIIGKVLKSESPCVCEVVVDSTQKFSPKSSSKILPDGRIVSTSIDDMEPFLPSAEMAENVYINQE